MERQLGSTSYDCVVIGAGVRLPPRNLTLFEALINAIRKAAPGTAIAFNTRPDDTVDAAARWVTGWKPSSIIRSEMAQRGWAKSREVRFS